MITVPNPCAHFTTRDRHGCIIMVQAPLPAFLHTLPILVTIEGQGSGRQGPPPLAPPEEPANDNA